MAELTQENLNRLKDLVGYDHDGMGPWSVRDLQNHASWLLSAYEEQDREIERLRMLVLNVQDGLARGVLGEHASEPCPCSLHTLLEELKDLREAGEYLMEQIEKSNFRDGLGHPAENLDALHELRAALAASPEPAPPEDKPCESR